MGLPAPQVSAWDCALRYLGQRNHSQFELEQKLSRRGFSAEETEQTIVRLHDAQLIDDEQFARDLAKSLLEKRHKSYRSLQQELKKRGIDPEVSEAVLSQNSPEDDLSRALILAEKRAASLCDLDRMTQRRRLFSYLARRGFSEGVCGQVLRQIDSENA